MKKNSAYIEKLKNIVKSTYNMRQTLNLLNLKAAGGNYKSTRNIINRENIDISHWTGRGWSRGKVLAPKKNIEEYLIDGSTILSFKLKKRLIRENFFKKECSVCKRKKWMGNDIPLELDHIDGKNNNNKIENLRLICPNCHALTPTYRGKNKKRNNLLRQIDI